MWNAPDTHTHTHTLSFVVPLHLLQLQQTVEHTTKVVWTMLEDQKQMRKDQLAVGATVYVSIVYDTYCYFHWSCVKHGYHHRLMNTCYVIY